MWSGGLLHHVLLTVLLHGSLALIGIKFYESFQVAKKMQPPANGVYMHLFVFWRNFVGKLQVSQTQDEDQC